MNIAIFGGSFDPPHIGHESIVNETFLKFNIDKLFIVPTFLNPFKNKSFLSPLNRYELCLDLFQSKDNIEVLDYEINQNKAIPTIQTVNFIKNNNDNIKHIYLIIGADNLKELEKWHNFDNLSKLVTFIVATRDNIKIHKFQTLHIDYDISSTRIRENLDITLIPKKIQKKVKKFWKIE